MRSRSGSFLCISQQHFKPSARSNVQYMDTETDISKTAGTFDAFQDETASILSNSKKCELDSISNTENIQVYVRIRPFLNSV